MPDKTHSRKSKVIKRKDADSKKCVFQTALYVRCQTALAIKCLSLKDNIFAGWICLGTFKILH